MELSSKRCAVNSRNYRDRKRALGLCLDCENSIDLKRDGRPFSYCRECRLVRAFKKNHSEEK